jgi:hypothetical protein
MTKLHAQRLLETLNEAIDAQKECRHQHHCHRLPDLWEIEDAIQREITEQEIAESERICRTVNA